MRKKNKNRHSFHHHHNHHHSIMSMAINLVNNNHNNHYYIINSVILIFVFISILWSSFQIVQINAFEDLNNDELSTFCIIGQLFKCNDDEDCIELDDDQNHSKDHHHHIDIPIGQRLGNCVCRDSNHCKRSIKTDNNMQLPQSDHLSNLVNYQTNSNLKLIISISMIMAIIGFLSFIIYYYGIRYGMIQYYARRLGLINNRQNSNIEDNQLLNHISSTTTTTTANHDDIELTL